LSDIEFRPWPSIPRMFRPVIITEKIDGTNSAVGVLDLGADHEGGWPSKGTVALTPGVSEEMGLLPHWHVLYAQSRKRIITPEDDNFGFAHWVRENAEELARTLGEGLHFGEWWGSGIQRGYGLLKGEKRWSLFNVSRHRDTDFSNLPGVGIVPILFEGMMSTHTVEHQIAILRTSGSVAAPGYMDPEGLITFHTAANLPFKTTVEDDEKPKSLVEKERP
jgi:hypothetical protein